VTENGKMWRVFSRGLTFSAEQSSIEESSAGNSQINMENDGTLLHRYRNGCYSITQKYTYHPYTQH